MLFEDGEQSRFALERQQGYDTTLVTGLDLPWVADGLQRDASQAREPVDALVRSLLQHAQVPFQVVYGQGPQRVKSALQALHSAGLVPAGAVREGESGKPPRAWVWVCEKCSDPGCEHRLFRQLKERRG
jgi:hypothetical protein